MKRVHFWLLLCVLGLLVTGSPPVLAQEMSEIPQITIEATSDGFTAPEEIPEGVVRISAANNTEAPIIPVPTRFNEGVTLDDFMEALSQGEEAVLPLISLLGGQTIMPGTTVDVIYDLTPGNYVFAVFAGFDEAPGVYPFTVADEEGDGASMPEADLEVNLVDFAFGIPLEIAAGAHTVHLENRGEQWHEMFIGRVDETLTMSEIHERLAQALAEATAEEPLEGIEEVAFWFPMSPGEQAWLTLDLEPGTYLILCGLPDLSGSGHAHAELGMRQIFTVSD